MENQNNARSFTMVKGEWKCSQCGMQITELPFQPDGVKPIFCRDCHRQRVAQRPNRQY